MMAKLLAGLLAVALFVLSCGTAHQFVPPRALEKGKWQLQLYWHYDLNHMRGPVSLIVPEFNAYVGAGRNYNVGGGLQFPFWVQHLTVSRTFSQSSNNAWMWYAHLNGPFGPVNNPTLEAGVIYTNTRGSLHHSLAVGLATMQRPVWDLDRPDDSYSWLNYNLIPTLKYVAAGRDLGFSWAHYHGSTLASVDILRKAWQQKNDTLIAIAASDIKSIDSTGASFRMWPRSLVITMSNDSQFVLSGWPDYVDAFGPRHGELLMQWLGGDYKVYRYTDHSAITSPSEIMRAWKEGKPVIITRYAASLRPRFSPWRSFIDDNSLAIGLIFHPKSH